MSVLQKPERAILMEAQKKYLIALSEEVVARNGWRSSRWWWGGVCVLLCECHVPLLHPLRLRPPFTVFGRMLHITLVIAVVVYCAES